MIDRFGERLASAFRYPLTDGGHAVIDFSRAEVREADLSDQRDDVRLDVQAVVAPALDLAGIW